MQSIKNTIALVDFTSPAPALLVAVFFLLAVGSWLLFKRLYKRHQRKRWTQRNANIWQLKKLSWQDFEIMAAEAFRAAGWVVQETGGGGADEGVDLILKRNGRSWIAQCKHYKARVGAPVVREMVGVAVKKKAAGVVVVGLNGFTKAARDYAGDLPVHLIDGPALLKMIEKSKRQKTQ